MPETPVVQTTVEQVDADIQDIFQLSSQTTPKVVTTTPAGKPNIFSREGFDTAFLDTPPANDASSSTTEGSETTGEKEKKAASAGQQPTLSLDAILKETDIAQETGEGAATAGNTTVTKGAIPAAFTKLIESGTLVPFDDAKPLEEYSAKDFEELLQANFQDREQKTYAQVSTAFFDSLPKELQYAAKYVQDGGQDLKGLFQALAQVEHTRELDPEKVEDQETIYRQYLSAIGFGSADEIEEELRTWKDLGQLDKKAKQAKPKLDKLQEQQVSRHLEEQEALRRQNEAAAKAYVDHVYQALQPGELNGVKLDKRTQSFLYNALVQPQYASMSGRPTNLLGHLLEKYQYTEPNYSLLAEALWLLSDPETYRAKLKQQGATQEAVKTVRTLKTEEGRKNNGQQEEKQNPFTAAPARKLTRPGNIFQR